MCGSIMKMVEQSPRTITPARNSATRGEGVCPIAERIVEIIRDSSPEGSHPPVERTWEETVREAEARNATPNEQTKLFGLMQRRPL
ncbi:hypothetical protein COT62_02055 [Candidatus Roizmanbacteria bacterium CG09_land_8_20_14_0_10_41_9]|uniref:Uncharacterized protein n=1 Tax=Candidatus Roizmanbacteria bacterium CG09_land_8_20_14_0_10_41_9 TaxID=1974850 RepID=A0A2H0WT20_9BACT|nr:MAG: hypothetical protein COT62_02055 [Candidatus Roizmanbacteria bacterium CG09_land_8_20_14_0_10_41_9]